MTMAFEETPFINFWHPIQSHLQESHLQVPRGWNPCKWLCSESTHREHTPSLFSLGNNMNTARAKDRKITLASLAPKHSALASTRVTTAAQLWYSGCTPKPKPKMTKSPCLGPDSLGKCKSGKTNCATCAVEFRKLLIYFFLKWNHVAHMTSNKIATLCHKSKHNRTQLTKIPTPNKALQPCI